MHNENDSLRFKAIDELKKITPNLKQQQVLLKEAAAKFPAARYDWQTIPGMLVEAATKTHDLSLIKVIQENYAGYDKNAKTAALTFLSNYPDRSAIQTFLDLLTAYPKEINFFPNGILDKKFSYKDIVFPRVLNLLDEEHLQADIALLLIDYLHAQQLDPKDYEKYGGQLVDLSKRSRLILLKEQASGLDRWDNDAYLTERENAGIYADALGYFNSEQAIAELREYEALKDSKLKMFALLSLLKLNQPPDVNSLTVIAADPESRKWFYDDLVALKKEDLFPSKYKTQEAFAESDMINWLLYPTELGRIPDSLQLMKVVTIDSHSADGIVEFYLYRFKSNHEDWKEKGWMSGVSGYFAQKEKPSTNASGYTFSEFEKWESKTPDEHVREIRDLIEKYYDTKR